MAYGICLDVSTPMYYVRWNRTQAVTVCADPDNKVWWYQVLAAPAQAVANKNSVTPQHRDSDSASASGSGYLSLLARQTKQKLKPLWSSGSNDLQSGEDTLLHNVSPCTKVPQSYLCHLLLLLLRLASVSSNRGGWFASRHCRATGVHQA